MNDVLVTKRANLSHGIRRTATVCLLTAMALGMSACSSTGIKMPWSDAQLEESGKAATSSDDSVLTSVNAQSISLISTNLLDAIAQYPSLSPQLATVQVTPGDNIFEQRILLDMEEQGYKLEESNAGPNQLTAEIRPALEPDAPLYVVSIGDISAERHYTQIDGTAVPVSEMVIRGGEQRTIVPNDEDVFGKEYDGISDVVFQSTPDLNLETLFSDNSESDTQKSEAAPSPLIKQNIYETLQSNYAGLLDEYEEIDRQVLVFPNDSLRLGDTNKQVIEEYVSKMNPETDVISVIGCSHGNTEINNGNSLLALGRANRVKEAFLFSGVEHTDVLEEGCWAPTTFDQVMPNRGVVLTLKRRKDS